MSPNSNSIIDLGLMGGMFDPVHVGHLNLVVLASQIAQLDEVHLLPCGTPVHKDKNYASSKHRLAMLKLAISDYPNLYIDDRECRSREPSYTQNSLLSIHHEKPDCRLFFIMGQDAFNSLTTWYNWQGIFSLAHIIIAGRPGIVPKLNNDLKQQYETRIVSTIKEMKQFSQGKIFRAEIDEKDISSSKIRESIAMNKSVTNLVPAKVEKYLLEKKLYKT